MTESRTRYTEGERVTVVRADDRWYVGRSGAVVRDDADFWPSASGCRLVWVRFDHGEYVPVHARAIQAAGIDNGSGI